MFSIKAIKSHCGKVPLLCWVAVWILTFLAWIYLASTKYQQFVTEVGSGNLWDIVCWWKWFILAYVVWMIPLVHLAKAEIKLVVGFADTDKETSQVANYIASSAVVIVTLIWLLLAFDYYGHTENAEYKARTAQVEAEKGSVVPAPNWIEATGGFLGTYGDFFGGFLNPILTFGTLIALGISMLQQRIQLREARSEAKTTGKYAQTQAFESTLFNMLNLHAQNVQHLGFDPAVIPTPASSELIGLAREVYLGTNQLPVTPPPAQGRSVFGEVLKSIERGASKTEKQVQIYRKLQDEHNDVLGHYFRHLYQILHHIAHFKIDGKPVADDVLHGYARIVRAQLSSHELTLLLINCTKDMVDQGRFRELLNQFKLLEHLPVVRNGNKLSARYLDDDSTSLFFQYLERDQSEPPLWVSGAFGSNKKIAEFLLRQGQDDWVIP